MRVDIIVVHYGFNQQLNAMAFQCLRSIRKQSQPGSYRLFWVDNGSPSPSPKIEAELTLHPDKVVLRNHENVGFTKAVNQALALSDADVVILMNNDAEAAREWLEKLAGALTGKVGLAGPRTTNRHQWQGKTSHRSTVILQPGAMLAFFLCAIRRDVLDKVGLLHDGFDDGFGGDDLYCARAQKAGFELALVGELVCPHNHRTTFRALYTDKEIAEMQTAALDNFRRQS